MKLINFESWAVFNNLRDNMGAELVDAHDGGFEWEKLDLKLRTEGLDVSVDEIDINDLDGTFSYKGRKVVIHIRDFKLNPKYDQANFPKFHVSNCKTIQNMKKNGRFEARYVVSTRNDGFYLLNIFDIITSDLLEKMVERELDVCKHCLDHVNFNGYNDNRAIRKDIFNNFHIDDYFKQYGSTTVSTPPHTDKSAPLNCYTDEWDKISNDYRSGLNWRCEECRLDLSSNKGLLHVHHIDGVKGNNKISNFKALCFACHAEQPGRGHESLKRNNSYTICLKLRNKKI